MKHWQTTPVQPTDTRHPWKRSIGEACPHGCEIFLVNGTYLRNTYDSDMVQGANGYRYRFCPRRELWVDDCTPAVEIPFVALHECHEAELMKHGMSYEQAHDRAKRLENKFRRDYFGMSPR